MYKVLLEIYGELLHSSDKGEKGEKDAKVFIVQKKADGKTQTRLRVKNEEQVVKAAELIEVKKSAGQ